MPAEVGPYNPLSTAAKPRAGSLMRLDFTGRWSRKAGVTCSSLAHQPCEEPGLSDTDLGNYQYKKTLLTSTIPTFLPVPGCPEPTRRCVFGAASLPSPLHPCRPLEGNISLKPETSSSAGMALSSASLRSAVLPYAQQRFLAWESYNILTATGKARY